MTSIVNASPLEELKTRQRGTWSSGDYGRIAWITVPLADELCDAASVRAGSAVLDVATGTGHVALSAARRFCHVTGVDYVPALLEIACARAVAEQLDVDFREGDAEALSYGDESYEFVLSALGVMFTADHNRAASELIRTCRRGGTIAMINWTPTGFVGDMLRLVGRHVPPPAAAKPATLWGTEDYVRELLADEVVDFSFERRSIIERFPSTEFFADFFIANYGPTLKASEALGDSERNAFRADLVALAEQSNQAHDGTYAGEWEYAVIVAARR